MAEIDPQASRKARSPKAAAIPRRSLAAPAKPGAGRGLQPIPPGRQLSHRHPELGLAPLSMNAGFPATAESIRHDCAAIAAGAVGLVVDRDPEFRARFGERALAGLLHDTEMLTERLAMCLASADGRWLPEYAEWMSPVLRRRGVAQADFAAICDALRDTVAPRLRPEEQALAASSIDAAAEVFRKNGRLSGDPHKRNALLRWLYRGV